MLSDTTYAWLALLLNVIEDGADWPSSLLHAKAAFLSKDDDPLAYRILMLMPVLYRKWATTRLHDLRPWVSTWQVDGIYAGVEGYGADDAWYETAIQLELYRTANTPHTGATTDIFKCFDQICRPLLYHLALLAGIHPHIINTYKHYIENVHIHNSLAQGLGKPHRRPAGIPQGCLLSMMFCAFICEPGTLALSTSVEFHDP